MHTHADDAFVVLVPAYNEEASIAGVVSEIRQQAVGADVVVIDDGSGDGTAGAARAAGATVIRLQHNLGIGGAVQTGYRYAVAQGYRYVVRMDGDGQHDASCIGALLSPLRSGQADVVIGTRFGGQGTYRAPIARALGIRLFSLLVRLVTGQRFTDTTSGFQACTLRAARFLAARLPSDYPEIEGLILLCRAGFRVQEVAVTMRARQSGVSSIGRLRALYYVLKVTLAVCIDLLRPAPVGEE